MAMLDDIYAKVIEIENELKQLPQNLRVINASQIITDSLSAITANLGVVRAGEIMSFNYISGVSGFRITATGGVAYFAGDAITLNNTGLNLYNLSNSKKTALLAASGDFWIGSDISLYSGVSLISFANAQTYNGEAMGAGDLLLGDSSSGLANIFWDRSLGQFKLRSGTTDVIVLDAASPGSIRSGNYAAGLTGFKITSPGDAEFNNVNARGAISSSVLVYNERHAVSGTLVVTVSAGKVKEDFTIPSVLTGIVNVDIEDPPSGHAQLFEVNDIALLQTGSISSWFIVTIVSDQTTFWRYTFFLVSGSTGSVVRKGAAVANYGKNFGWTGWLEMVAQKTNSEGPYYSVRQHNGVPWSSSNELARLGNLRNSYGAGANNYYGVGIGSYSDGNFLSYNADGGGTFLIQGGGGSVKITGSGLSGYNGTAATFKIDTIGNIKLGSNILSPSTLSLLVLSQDQTWNDEALGAGDLLLGDNSPLKANVLWDRSAGKLNFRGGTTTQAYIDTTGKIVAGGGIIEMSADGIKFLDTATDVTKLRWYYLYNSAYRLVGRTMGDYGGVGVGAMWLTSSRVSGDPWPSADTVIISSDTVGGTESRIDVRSSGSIGIKGSLNMEYDGKPIAFWEDASGDLMADILTQYADSTAKLWIRSWRQTGDGWSSSSVLLRAHDDVAGTEGALSIYSSGDVNTEGFTNYSITSTVTGWSSTTQKAIYYKKIGKLVFVWFFITGTSNNTVTTFTLPYATKNDPLSTAWLQGIIRVIDNSGAAQAGIYYMTYNSNLVTFLSTVAGAGWTASGTKMIIGQFCYEAA